MRGNTVYVGGKPPMAYVTAIITNFNRDGAEEVVLRARGRAISTAVDAAEITMNRFLPDLTYSVEIGTERMRTEDGERNVSTMEITLRKPRGRKPRGREPTTQAG